MASFNLKQKLQNENKQSVITNMLGVTTKTMTIPYTQLEFGEFKKYDIDEEEVVDLANSIATLGLEQNLVVKETDNPNRYIVVTGHKRTTAIRYIFENEIPINAKVKKSIEEPNCIVIPKDEDELITRFRMHETNVHQRKGFTISEIEDYMKTVEMAKERKLEVNGKQIKGTTRAILKARFNIGETTARRYIKVIKEGNEELKKAIDNGDISINNAYDVLMGVAEPIIQGKEKTIDDLKLSSIAGSSEKKKKEISLGMIDKTYKKLIKDTDKIIKEIEKYKEEGNSFKNHINAIEKINNIKAVLLELEDCFCEE